MSAGDRPAVVVVKEHSGNVTVNKSKATVVVQERSGVITVVAAKQGPPGPPGPEGPPGQWQDLTQAEFDALSPPDPDTLYVIIG